jgi:hypothetical protein
MARAKNDGMLTIKREKRTITKAEGDALRADISGAAQLMGYMLAMGHPDFTSLGRQAKRAYKSALELSRCIVGDQ